jgi:hypothetical protein
VKRPHAAIGFTVKSGWASAALLSGSVTAPRLLDSRRVDLSDPSNPESRQPYHAGFGTARSSGRELSRLLASVKRFGRQSVEDLIRQHRAAGYELRGVGVIVGSLIDPASIANDHIRIHALEGRLFRSVVEDAAARSRLRCLVWRERDLYATAVGVLNQPERKLRETLAALGKSAAGPWRAEQKAAALAAWLLLGGRAAASSAFRPRPSRRRRSRSLV